jgi:hypothetical protein
LAFQSHRCGNAASTPVFCRWRIGFVNHTSKIKLSLIALRGVTRILIAPLVRVPRRRLEPVSGVILLHLHIAGGVCRARAPTFNSANPRHRFFKPRGTFC